MRDAINTTAIIIVMVTGIYLLLGIRSQPEAPLNQQQSVLVRSAEQISPGMVLHTVRSQAIAWLVDNEGIVRHQWDIKKYVPTQSRFTLKKSPLQHIEPRADGALLAVVKDSAIVTLDSNSNLLSFTEGHFHHDVDTLDDGTIVALERKPLKVTYNSRQGVLLNDHIVLINKDGSRRAEYPLFEMFTKHFSEETIEHAFSFSATARPEEIRNDTPADVLHTNSVEILANDIPDVAPKGSALVSFRHLDLIAIVDYKKQAVLWEYGPGELSWQHAPTTLDNGNILIFDNGTKRKTSRVIEVNPVTKKIVWQFDVRDYDEPEFFSAARGSAQRLKNGNTLISIGERGKAIEVTPAKEIVWKYAPEFRIKRVRKGKERVRARKFSIYRIFKVEDEKYLEKLMKG